MAVRTDRKANQNPLLIAKDLQDHSVLWPSWKADGFCGLKKNPFPIDRGTFGEQRTEFGEKNNCPAVDRDGEGSIVLWGCVATSGNKLLK